MSLAGPDPESILVIRLGAMGDIIHALPAVASLKKSFPRSRLAWLVAERWMPLLDGNPAVDDLISFDRSGLGALRQTWLALRKLKPDLAIDFQGLVQSAMAGRAAAPRTFLGFDRSVAREPLASSLYSRRVPVRGPHRIERNLQLIAASGASTMTHEAWIPAGELEQEVPAGPFVLASPFAGWKSKEWPLERYEALAEHLNREGVQLVANVPPDRLAELSNWKHVRVQTSSIRGLIAATRRATAILGLDSGPLHLAAALRKPGVALFGPTDPACTGPFGGSMTVLRASDVKTTYKRHKQIHPSMKDIPAEAVAETLRESLAATPALNHSETPERAQPVRGL
jgi:heptosyltransferase I